MGLKGARQGKFEEMARQLFIQIRGKFVEVAKEKGWMGELKRREVNARLRHDSIILFLKD